MNSFVVPRLLAGMSQREVAAIAGVSSSTVARIENGTLEPSVARMERLFAAVGYAFPTPQPSYDRSALAAFRGLLDPSPGLADFEGASEWVQRWKRAKLINAEGEMRDMRRLAVVAAAQVRLVARPGIVTGWSSISSAEVATRLCSAGINAAASGVAGAQRVTRVGSDVWQIVYVEDVEAAIDATQLGASGIGLPMSLIPFDNVTSIGCVRDADGAGWVDPLQVLLDCYAGNDRMPDQADLLADALLLAA